MSTSDTLQQTINDLVVEGKGILAADESQGTIGKRFAAIGVESTEETRRAYRTLLATTENIGDYLAGIILFEETLTQATNDGTLIPEALAQQGIVPGIKVDKGLVSLPFTDEEQTTAGLDGLAERLRVYREQGARFTKWRNVYRISATTPSPLAISANAEVLARYAAICQAEGFVPIVEPEVLIDGDHTIERCEEVTDAALQAVFEALHRHKVALEHIVLKPNMVVAGKSHQPKPAPEEVAERTLRVLMHTVPSTVPTINFLSGGQTPEEATANLNAMNRIKGRAPWQISFSFARALQEPAMDAWRGNPDNVAAAQQAFLTRAKLNQKAQLGQYEASMEAAS